MLCLEFIDQAPVWYNRSGFYARLGVAEIWAYDSLSLRCYRLQKNGKYKEARKSKSLPFLPLAEFARWIEIPSSIDEMTHLKRFAAWVREQEFRAG